MTTPGDVQFAVNARVYHAPGVERAYQTRELTRVEVMALLKYHDAFAQRDVLDIGVGTGRTSLYLAPLARHYEAIDYSPVMVRYLHETMPQLTVRQADMRDLSVFADACFDFLLATNNVIDAVGHEDRIRALREAARVLRPGGVLMLSTHNRHYRGALHGPHLSWSRNPITEVRNLHRWLRQLGNHARVGPLRELHADYALLNDEGHHYALLHYYIDQATQRRQLGELGFGLIEAMDAEGRSLTADDRAENSASVMFVVRKMAAPPDGVR